jgi:aerobic-type carbon monoxide dehydrogenase small subunit (CoxS/CutS family)
MTETTINGIPAAPDVEPEKPLLWVLRDELGLKGTKFGCGVGVCGICLVLVDDHLMHACVTTWEQVRGRRITTIEGLAARGHPVLDAWIAEQVPQCGYCQPGQVVAATALLNAHPHPSDTQIDEAMSPVLCRCGTYHRIRKAVHRAAQSKRDD